MEEVRNIYLLLLHNNGLKTRDIANKLELDRYYVAEILFSPQCVKYWYQDDDSLWFAKEGAIQIEESAGSNDEPKNTTEIPRRFNISRFLQENVSDSLRAYLYQISKCPVYSNEEILELFKRYHDGDNKAFRLILMSQQKLVANIALLYSRKGYILEDIIQEGNIGLIKAVNKFDYTQYYNFTNFAKSWILQSVSFAMSSMPFMVRLPQNQMERYRKVRRFKEKYEQKYNIPPSVNDIEIGLNIEPEKADYINQLPDSLYNLTQFVDDMDVYECPDSAVEVFEEKDYSRYQAWNYIRVLNKRQRTIVRKFFGIGYKKAETMTIIADEMGYTRERIRQIIEKSLKIMREASLTAIIIDNNYDEQSVGVGGYGQAGAKGDVIAEYKSFLKDTKFKSTKEDKPILKEKIETLAPIVKQEEKNTNELNGLKVGDILLYKEKIATVKKILLVGSASKLIIKYENDVLDVVTNNPSKYKVLRSHKTDGIRNVVKELRDVPVKKNSDKGDVKIENERKRVIEFPFLPLQFLPEEEIEKKEEKKSEKKEEYPKKEKVLKSGYGLSTPLRNLVDQKIITKVQLKHCRKKGLNTIGDVFQIIEKYHLTPDSTRFTKYTIDIWFAIVNFAKAKGIISSDSESTSSPEDVKMEINEEPADDIEIVYVDIPSADPYIEFEVSSQEEEGDVLH